MHFYEKEEHVYLCRHIGIILDHKPSWNLHLNYITQRAVASLWQSKRLFKNTWRLSPKIYVTELWSRFNLTTVQEQLTKHQKLNIEPLHIHMESLASWPQWKWFKNVTPQKSPWEAVSKFSNEIAYLNEDF